MGNISSPNPLAHPLFLKVVRLNNSQGVILIQRHRKDATARGGTKSGRMDEKHEKDSTLINRRFRPGATVGNRRIDRLTMTDLLMPTRDQ